MSQQGGFQAKKKPRDIQIDALKMPPHSIEAEQSVLGGLMLDSDAWDKVAEAVVKDDFYSRSHKMIFTAMESLVAAGQPIDLITVSVRYLGAAPEEVEEGVCVKIEEAIQDLEDIKRLTSTSSEGVGTVMVELESGTRESARAEG